MILAIETSSARHSICLARIESPHTDVLNSQWDAAGRSGRLLLELDGLREYLPGVRLIAIGTGPGSFSGIRAAISAAKGLRSVLGCPLTGICSADTIGCDLAHVSRLGVFADAKRGEFYMTEYRLGARSRGPITLPAADLENHLSKLTMAVSAEPLSGVPERAWPTATTLARLAAHAWRQGPDALRDPEPIYLRGPTIAPPAKRH